MYDWRYIFGNDKNKFDYGNYLQGILGYTFNFDIEGINHKSITMKRYLNFKGSYGVETVDELSMSDFNTAKDFRKELNRLVKEYSIAGISVYISSRCTKDWK